TGLGAQTDVRALAVNPATPSTLYAGLGGLGVFKSVDGAGHWTAVNSGLGSHDVRALAIDPKYPTNLYAGTFEVLNGTSLVGGVFESFDAGGHWQDYNSGLTPPYLSILGFAIVPTNHAIVYAATLDGVFKSVDAGGMWSPENNGLPPSGYRVINAVV